MGRNHIPGKVQDALGVVDLLKERELRNMALGPRRLALKNVHERTIIPADGKLPEYRPTLNEAGRERLERELRGKALKPKPWAIEAAGMFEIPGGGQERHAPTKMVDWTYYGYENRGPVDAKNKGSGGED